MAIRILVPATEADVNTEQAVRQRTSGERHQGHEGGGLEKVF